MKAARLVTLAAVLSALGVHGPAWGATPLSDADAEPGLTLAYGDSSLLAGNRLERRVRPGLLLSGALALGAGYVLGCVVGLASTERIDREWLALPIAGPIIAGVQWTSRSDLSMDTRGVLLFLDAGVQAVGLALLIARVVGRQVVVPVGPARMALTPLFTPRGEVGLGVTGSFP